MSLKRTTTGTLSAAIKAMPDPRRIGKILQFDSAILIRETTLNGCGKRDIRTKRIAFGVLQAKRRSRFGQDSVFSEIFSVFFIRHGNMGQNPVLEIPGKGNKAEFPAPYILYLFHHGQDKGVMFLFVFPVIGVIRPKQEFFFSGKMNLYIVHDTLYYLIQISPLRFFVSHTMIEQIVGQSEQLLMLVVDYLYSNR
jgi:hypothetical protein